jgi:hypothetical protein
MGGFIKWLSLDLEGRREKFAGHVLELRNEVAQTNLHARTPQMIAELRAGFELFVEFAADAGAVSPVDASELRRGCGMAMGLAAVSQSKYQLATDPAIRYIELLRSLLALGRAHLQSRVGAEPQRSPEACGWRKGVSWEPRGECIGWVDDDNIYIEPSAAFQKVQAGARDTGETIGITEGTLRKRLNEKGFLASTEFARETLTVRRTIGGSSKSVLHFLRSTILPDEDSEEELQ